MGPLDGIMEPVNPLFSHVRLNAAPALYSGREPVFDESGMPAFPTALPAFAAAPALYRQPEPVFDQDTSVFYRAAPAFGEYSPLLRSDAATPTTLVSSATTQFASPILNGGDFAGVGAVQDAISALSFVDLLTRA